MRQWLAIHVRKLQASALASHAVVRPSKIHKAAWLLLNQAPPGITSNIDLSHNPALPPPLEH